MNNKKIWFEKLNWNFWIPISWEGWIIYSIFILCVVMVYMFNDDVIFVFKDHWPILLELGIPIALFYWITRDRVKKR